MASWLCVTILSLPFQDDIPLPAASSGLLERLLNLSPDFAHPGVPWMHAIYAVLRALGPDALGRLALQKVLHLQSLVRRVLQSRPTPGHKIQLLGLSILAHIASMTFSDKSSEVWPTRSSSPLATTAHDNELAYSRQYFAGEKAGRSLDIAVIGSSLYCSEGDGPSLEEALLGLKLAAEVGNRVRADMKACWIKENRAKVRKLALKIASLNSGSSLKGGAARVLVSLVGYDAAAQQLDCSADDIVSDQIWVNEYERDLGLLTPVLTSSFIEKVLDTASGLLSDACNNSIEAISSLVKTRMVIRYFCDLTALRCQTVELLSSSMAADTVRARLASSFRASPKPPIIHSDPVQVDKARRIFCPNAITVQQELLKVDMCVLISTLRTVPISSFKIDAELVTAAVKWLATATRMPDCVHGVAFQQTHLPTELDSYLTRLVQYQSPNKLNRNEELRQHLYRAADIQHQHFVQTWTSVCRDLQARCEHVEVPLREERRHADMLNCELKSERALMKSLQEEMSKQRIEKSELEAAHVSLTSELQSTTAEAARLSKETVNLRDELINAKHMASEQASLNRHKELTTMGELTVKAEELEQMSRELVAAQTLLQTSKDETSQLRDQVNDSRHSCQVAEKEKTSLIKKSESQQEEIKWLHAKVSSLEGDNTRFLAEIQQAKVSHREHEKQLETINEQHVLELQARDSEAAKSILALTDQLEASRQARENEQTRHDVYVKEQAQRLASLTRSVKCLEAKLEDVAQARELLNGVSATYRQSGRRRSAAPLSCLQERPETPGGATAVLGSPERTMPRYVASKTDG